MPALCLKLNATPDRFRVGARSTRSGSGDCPGSPAVGPPCLQGNVEGRRRLTRVGSEQAWVREQVARGALVQLDGHAGGLSVAAWLFLRMWHSFCFCQPALVPIVWGKEEVAAGKESQGACDEDPKPARSAEGRSRKPWAWVLERGCGWKEAWSRERRRGRAARPAPGGTTRVA